MLDMAMGLKFATTQFSMVIPTKIVLVNDAWNNFFLKRYRIGSICSQKLNIPQTWMVKAKNKAKPAYLHTVNGCEILRHQKDG